MHKKENISYIATLLFTLTALTSMVIYNISSFYSNAVSNMDKMCESSLAKEKEYLEEYLANCSREERNKLIERILDYMKKMLIEPQ